MNLSTYNTLYFSYQYSWYLDPPNPYDSIELCNYTLQTVTPICRYWNTETESWDTDGCKVSHVVIKKQFLLNLSVFFYYVGVHVHIHAYIDINMVANSHMHTLAHIYVYAYGKNGTCKNGTVKMAQEKMAQEIMAQVKK